MTLHAWNDPDPARAECEADARADEEAGARKRVLEWGPDGVTYQCGSGEPVGVAAWNIHLWFENGDSTHMRTEAPKRRRR